MFSKEIRSLMNFFKSLLVTLRRSEIPESVAQLFNLNLEIIMT